MYQPKVTITGCSRWSDAEAFYETRETRLNLPKCKEYAKENKIEFHEFVARCVNHEFIHHLLHEEQDIETSHDLDNIAKKYKDYWMW